MAPFERKYSAAAIQAIHDARFARNLTYKRIQSLARTGELVPGEQFDISTEYIGELCRKENQRRAGKVESRLADRPHKDAIEVLRRRMISAADSISKHYDELAAKNPAKVDVARGREITRLVREAIALPGPKDETPNAPGTKVNGHQNEGPTRSGEAGSLLNAMRAHNTEPNRGAEPARDDATEDQDHDAVSASGSLTRDSATRIPA